MACFQDIQHWSSPDYPPIPVTGQDMEAAEARLSYRFPDSYRSAVLQVGLPMLTAELWDAIDEAELDLAHLADFLEPAESVDATLRWTALGMPADLIAFASDSAGNLFAFKRGAGDAVWFFDHDFGSTDQVAPSFEEWIGAYCRISR